MLGKVTRMLVLKFATSEVISKKPQGRWKAHPRLPVCLGLDLDGKKVFTIYFHTFLAKMIPSGEIIKSGYWDKLPFFIFNIFTQY